MAPTTPDTVQYGRGDFAVDTEQDDDPAVLVLEVTDDTAAEHAIEALADRTVAAENPTYPSEDCVVKAAYVSSLNHHLGSWRPPAVLGMYDSNGLGATAVPVYAFPASRLALPDTTEEQAVEEAPA